LPLKGVTCDERYGRPVQYFVFVQVGSAIAPPEAVLYGTVVISPPCNESSYRYDEMGSFLNQELTMFSVVVLAFKQAAAFP
jgi:hypothetical protein